MKLRLSYLYAALLFVCILLLWELGATSTRIQFLFASPHSIVASLIKHLPTLVYDTLFTGFESLLGFLIGIIGGTFFGFALWYSPKIAEIIYPYLFVLGIIPVIAFAPLIIIWFGIGIWMKIAMAAFGTFIISLTQAYEGAKSIDVEEFRLLKVFGASRAQVLWKVIFPASLSWVFASMKLNIGVALVGAFIGEFIAANHGIGHFMLLSGSLFDIPAVFAGGIFMIILALLFNCIILFVELQKMRIIRFFSIDNTVRALMK